MYQVTKAIDTGMGVLYIYGNYTGDIINFEMAGDMADMQDGIAVEHVLGNDDVASAPFSERHKRRGVAGIFYIYKIAGALAESGASLAEVKAIAMKTAEAVRTIGVASSPCTIPEVGKPSFILADDEMEIGMGIHGEPGIRRGKLKTADEIAEEMLNAVCADIDIPVGSEVSVLVNGLGSTPLDELYIVYRKLNELLKEKKISIFHSFVGEFATSMEMAGFSFSLLRLDEELKHWLSMPARTPFYTQFDLSQKKGSL